MSERSYRECIDENQSRPCNSGTCPEPSVSPWVPPDTNADSEAVRIARAMAVALGWISEVRTKLVTTRMEQRRIGEALALYEAQFDTSHVKALADAKALGSNAEARERALIIARANDPEWTRLSAAQVELESQHEHQRAALDDMLDAQTARRFLVRALIGREVE